MSPYVYLLPMVVWVGVLVVCVLSLYVAWRAMFGDRGQSKRRCPKCWYDLSYSPGMQCAECGYVARNEIEFQRTRRRPGVAVLALVICGILVLAVNDQMNQVGLLRHMPTRVLIWVLPIAGGMDGAVGHELDRRASSRQLGPEQWLALLERCAAGGWNSRPPSDNWIDDYGGFILNWRDRFINNPKFEAPLKNLPPRLEARTRDRWPEGAPIAVTVRLEDWWPAGMECRVRATPRLVNAPGNSASGSAAAANVPGAADFGRAITFYRAGDVRFRPSPFTMYLPPLSAGEHEIVIDFQVDRRRIASLAAPIQSATDSESPEEDDPELPWELFGKYSITLKTCAEGTVADLAQPASSAAMDALMAQVFGSTVRWTGGGRSPVRFGINAPATFTTEFDDTGVGVSVELERDGVVARRLNLWWIGGGNILDSKRNYGFEINYENLELLRRLNPDDNATWQLRVRSDPLLALRAGAIKQYWKGEFTVPINLRLSGTQAPPRMWWTEGEQAEKPTGDAPPAARGRRSF